MTATKIADLPVSIPKRAAVRELLYSILTPAKERVTVGEVEEFLNKIIDIAVSEAKQEEANKERDNPMDNPENWSNIDDEGAK